MNIISVKYKCEEENNWKFYEDEKVLDDGLELEYLLNQANVFVKEILEKHPNAVITQICIW